MAAGPAPAAPAWRPCWPDASATTGPTPTALEADDISAGKILVCQAVPQTDLILETREIATAADIEIKNLPARVEDIAPLTHDIMRLRLRLPASERSAVPGRAIPRNPAQGRPPPRLLHRQCAA
jgi:hypothetical protein